MLVKIYLMSSIHLSVEANILTLLIGTKSPWFSKINTWCQYKINADYWHGKIGGATESIEEKQQASFFSLMYANLQ